MALSDELAYLGVIEIARGIRQQRFSPVEVVDAFIARIELDERRTGAYGNSDTECLLRNLFP